MVDGKQRDDWSRHSTLLCLIANAHGSSKSKTFKPDEFNPFAKKNSGNIVLTKKNIGGLKLAMGL